MSGLAARVWRNECAGWMALGTAPEARGVFEIHRHRDLVCAWYQGHPDEMENYLLLGPRGSISELPSLIDEVRERIDNSRSATMVRYVQVDDSSWQHAATTRGFVQERSWPLLAVDTQRYADDVGIPTDVAVSEITDREEYEIAIGVTGDVYGSEGQLDRFFNPFGLPNIRLFCAWWNGKPAATATIWTFANLAGIYSVGTRLHDRGRGLASVLLGKMLHEAYVSDLNIAGLRTSDNIAQFYQRLGFEEVGRIQTWEAI